MKIEIREYGPGDGDEWMGVHAVILSISHAWNYSIQERPTYDDRESTQLVAFAEGRMVGLIDVQYDNEAGELCLLKDSRGGYVVEFGRLPEFAGHQIGAQLMEAAARAAEKKGVRRLEYWSQDRKAQRFYRRVGLPEIGRHYRFRIKAPHDVTERMQQDLVGIEYLYCACVPEEWPLIKKKYEVIERPPLEPHLCIGYEARF